mgnify:CR=1 FL=1
MMHSTCIAAFRTQTRRRHRPPHAVMPKSGTSNTPRLTALVEHQIHRCVQRRADKAAVTAFYTLCGYLVPPGNVEETCGTVTCQRCLGRAKEMCL